MIDANAVLSFINSEIGKIEIKRKVTFSAAIVPIFQLATLDSISLGNAFNEKNTEDVTKLLAITFKIIDEEIGDFMPPKITLTVKDLMEIIKKRWCNVFPFCKTID